MWVEIARQCREDERIKIYGQWACCSDPGPFAGMKALAAPHPDLLERTGVLSTYSAIHVLLPGSAQGFVMLFAGNPV